MTELKRCPFCGEIVEMNHTSDDDKAMWREFRRGLKRLEILMEEKKIPELTSSELVVMLQNCVPNPDEDYCNIKR